MIAVILCAGKGSRLDGLANEIPKTLLKLDENRTILDTILDSVSPWVEHTVVVAGHCSERLVDYTASMPTVDVHVVDDVDKFNNARSLWSALTMIVDQKIDGDVIVANGDTVLHPTATSDLVKSLPENELALTIDSTVQLADEEMKIVVGPDRQVQQITKLVDSALAVGEFVGQSLIRRSALGPVLTALRTTWQTNPQDYYEDGYQLAIENGVKAGLVELELCNWSEVDNQVDLRIARNLSWL